MRRESWLYGLWLMVGVTIGFWTTQAGTIDPVKGFWEISSAVGTCAAVVVALVFSLAGQRTAQRHAAEKAALVAAEVIPTLDAVLNHSMHIEGHLIFYDDTTDAVFDFLRDNKFVTNRPLIVSAEILVGLIPLPNRCASRIAFGLSKFSTLHTEIVDTLAATHWVKLRPASRISLISEWADRLSDAKNYIRLAREDCIRAAELSAPPPTPYELYGDDFDDAL